MVNTINIWAQKIVVIIIICTIIEMILPEGKNKKYIKTVMGIYVIFTIISPVISKVNNKTLDLNKYFNLEYSNNTIETVAPIDTNNLIENVYIEKIKKDIEENIFSLGYKTKKIEIKIETDNQTNYGEIISINLNVEPKTEQSEKNIKINEIIIGKNEDKENNISKEEIRNIKNFLSKAYNLDEESIEVR